MLKINAVGNLFKQGWRKMKGKHKINQKASHENEVLTVAL